MWIPCAVLCPTVRRHSGRDGGWRTFRCGVSVRTRFRTRARSGAGIRMLAFQPEFLPVEKAPGRQERQDRIQKPPDPGVLALFPISVHVKDVAVIHQRTAEWHDPRAALDPALL